MSDIYKVSGLGTGIYDVFVKISDCSLIGEIDGLAGEDCIDAATGEIADRKMEW